MGSTLRFCITFAKKISLQLISDELENFAQALTTPEDALQSEVNKFTYAQHTEPHMLSGHLQGKLLEAISWMIRPKKILEIGTFTGYSALCLAKGLTDDGELHTIELRQNDADLARSFFDKSATGNKIISHVGNAKEIIPTLSHTWDLVFIDADKSGYIDYFNLVLPQVKQNGFILADNIFFHGEALQAEPKGKSAKAVKAFNEYVVASNAVEKVAITLRDGLYLLRKL